MLQGIQNRSMEWYISEINMHMNAPPVEYANAIYLSYTSTKLRQESNGTKQTEKALPPSAHYASYYTNIN